MTKLTPEEYQKMLNEMKVLEAQRLVKFQKFLTDNNHIMANDAAKELLEMVEEFLEEEGSWTRC